VAQVSESWFTLADSYGVDVPRQDDVLILACTVVIERCERQVAGSIGSVDCMAVSCGFRRRERV